MLDIEELQCKYDGLLAREFEEPTQEDCDRLAPFFTDLLIDPVPKRFIELKRKWGINQKNSFIMKACEHVLKGDPRLDRIKDVMKIKRGKSLSGVLVVTVFTSPYPEYTNEDGDVVRQEFTCHWNCAYCPNEPGQPRSYLKGEPGVMRANKNGFDVVRQMHDRMGTLHKIGHPVDKLEVIVLGGTWTSYPLKYREEFCRDIYYAANVFCSDRRARMALAEEMAANKDAGCRVIGLTLETRPDTITVEEVMRLRGYGCTRVQLGIQHVDEGVLKKIKRRCTTEDAIRAIALLKDHGFKVDAHWMPNLPGSNLQMDHDMFLGRLLALKGRVVRTIGSKAGSEIETEQWDLADPWLQVDQWKVYPCAVVPWTEIEEWYKDGSYGPYDDKEVLDLVIDIKTFVFPWIRLNRIIRDIPTDYIMNDHQRPNMRQDAKAIMDREGKRCMCIRCREAKAAPADGSARWVVREFVASGRLEHFISYESNDNQVLYGFCRLRCVWDTAYIRELHVYGQLQEVGRHGDDSAVQHKGIGRSLVAMAEKIAAARGATAMKVIAGEGTKRYYERLGYVEGPRAEGGYMTKAF